MSRQRLQRTIAGAGDGAAVTAVVEQRVDRFLQHALFVADDDVRRLELEQVLQPVVAVDDAAIEIVQIGGRETAAFERNERTQVRRDDRQHFEDHPLRTGVRSERSPGRASGAWRASCGSASIACSPIASSSSLLSFGEIDLARAVRGRLRHPSWRRRSSPYCSCASRYSISVRSWRLVQRGLARIDDDVILVIDDALELAGASCRA